MTVDVDAEPGLAEAFQLQAVPAMLALMAGRPVPLFQGTPDDQQLADVFAQVAEVARQAGMEVRDSGEAPAAEGEGEAGREAVAARCTKRRSTRSSARTTTRPSRRTTRRSRRTPRTPKRVPGRAQVSLIARSATADAVAVRKAAADAPDDLDAQMAVADLDVLGGMVDDAFDRLIDAVRATTGRRARTVRARLIELFDVVGPTDARVNAARQRLASALY